MSCLSTNTPKSSIGIKVCIIKTPLGKFEVSLYYFIGNETAVLTKSSLIFLVEIAFVPISLENKSFCPRRDSAHLLTYSIYRHPLIRLDDDLVMHRCYHKTVRQRLHTVKKQVASDRLRYILCDLAGEGFKPVPLLGGIPMYVIHFPPNLLHPILG